MNKYAVFFRGINVGGRNRINMSELTQSLIDEGFINVKTYLNSGNVILESELCEAPAVEKKVKSIIEQRFGLCIELIIRNSSELEAIVAADPFSTTDNNYVVLLSKSSNIDISLETDRVKVSEDELYINKNEVHLLVPGGFGKTKMTNGFFEKNMGVSATTRNIKTIRKVFTIMENTSGL